MLVFVSNLHTERHTSKKDRQHNGQKDKQRSTKHTHKTKDRGTQTPLKYGGELRYSGMVSVLYLYCHYLVYPDLDSIFLPGLRGLVQTAQLSTFSLNLTPMKTSY
jgi:hypothetical protein